MQTERLSCYCELPSYYAIWRAGELLGHERRILSLQMGPNSIIRRGERGIGIGIDSSEEGREWHC